MFSIIRNRLPIRTLSKVSDIPFNVSSCQYQSRPQIMNDRRPGSVAHRKHPYLAMYPWKNFQDFVDTLYSSIIYEDEYIVAIDKPWGVGTWSSALSVHKTNAHLLQMEYFGSYC